MKKTTLLIFLIIFAGTAFAYENYGNLIIRVTDDKGFCLSDVPVFLKADEGKRLIVEKTNASGNAVFRRLNPGIYKVSVKKEGFLLSFVSGITVYCEKATKKDITLSNKPLSGKKPEAIIRNSPAAPMTGNAVINVHSDEGQILPGAEVKLRSAALKGERTMLTGSNGRATFKNLPPGEYDIEVKMDGLYTVVETGIEIKPAVTAIIEEVLIVIQYEWFRTYRELGPVIDTQLSTIKHRYDVEHISKYLP